MARPALHALVRQRDQLGDAGVGGRQALQRRLDLVDVQVAHDARGSDPGPGPTLRPNPRGAILPPSKRSPSPISGFSGRSLTVSWKPSARRASRPSSVAITGTEKLPSASRMIVGLHPKSSPLARRPRSASSSRRWTTPSSRRGNPDASTNPTPQCRRRSVCRLAGHRTAPHLSR